jgi:hypothetical protein
MRQIFVDSRDRVAGTTTDFSIQLPETMTVGTGHRARVDNLRVPLVIPTIRSGVNDTIVVKLGAQQYTVSIPQANYDGPGLAAIIQNLLQATAPGSWTVAYDSSNIAMSISCSNNFTIVGGTYAAQLMARNYTQTAKQYKFAYVDVLGADILYLCSPNFATLDTIGPNGSHDILMAAIVTQPFGSVMSDSAPWDVWFDVPAQTTQSLSFQLRDRNYNLLTLVPNISFQLTID